MRNSRKRVVGALAGVAISALALSACTTGSDEGSGAAEVTELTLWASQSTPESVQTVIAEYEAASGVAIEMVTIPDSFETNTLTKFQTGQRPDIIFYQPGPGSLKQLNPAENLQDLGDMAFVDQTKFNLADSGVVDGVHYTATYDFPSVFGLYYNKQVFEANGIAVPTTKAELDEAAAELKAAGVTPFMITGGDAWTGQLGYLASLSDAVAAGGITAVNDGTGTVTTEDFVAAAGTARAWVENGWANEDYLTALYADVPAALQAGEVAMYPMASWMNSSFTDTANIGFVAYPSDTGVVQWQSSNNASVQLPKTGDAAREQAARDFVDYMTVGDGYKALLALTGNPSIIEGVEDPSEISPLNAAAAEAFAGQSVPSFDQQLEFQPDVRAGLLSEVLAGTISPTEFAEQYQAAIDKLRELQG